MAQHLTRTELRNYPVGTGTADLIKLISTDRPSSWVRATGVEDAPVGTVAYVSAMGSMRRGVVVKVTKTKIHVALTTQGAVDSARQHADYLAERRVIREVPIRVQIVVADPQTAFIAPKPEQAPAELKKLAQAEAVEQAHQEALMIQARQDSEQMHEQVEAWLARHAELGTPQTQWSLVEDARQADHAEALTLNSQAGKVSPMNNNASTQTEQDNDKIRQAMEAGTAFIPAWMKNEQDQATEKTAPSSKESTGSAVVLLLEKVWSRIRENHPELPAVVIVTGAGMGFGGGKWGHFRPNGWTAKVAEEGVATTQTNSLHEMFMAGETLAKGARQVLQTMLHEGAHTLAQVRKVQDTSRQGRWHNKLFRKTAEEMGLEYTHGQASPSLGFSQVTLTADTEAEYADLLDELDREIHLMVSLPGFLAGKGGEGADGGENMGKAPKGPAQPNTNNVKATCTCETPLIIRLSRKVLDLKVVRCDECESLFADRG